MTQAKQILIFTALPIEAKPLVRHFKMKKDLTRTNFDTFMSSNLTLVVSGLGKTKMAAAVGHSMAPKQQTPVVAAINIGIAGAPKHDDFQLGRVFVANKIIDAGSRREFFPDLLKPIGISETTVTTHDRPVTSNASIANYHGLVEMEASGFFTAASAFLPPHQISIIKVVSDHVEDYRLTEDLLVEYIDRSIPSLEKVIEAMMSIPSTTNSVLKPSSVELLQNLGRHLRLTSSQCRLLEDWAIGYVHRGGSGLKKLEKFMNRDIKEKHEGKLVLEQVRQLLNEE
jgi:adenosylhomocysteine nucleosidase